RPGWRARGPFGARPGNHCPGPDSDFLREVAVKLRVVVAEDNYVVRACIEKILEADPDIELVGSCGDLDSLDRLIAAASPHVVVTDIRMPPAQSDEGLEIARRLRRAE